VPEGGEAKKKPRTLLVAYVAKTIINGREKKTQKEGTLRPRPQHAVASHAPPSTYPPARDVYTMAASMMTTAIAAPMRLQGRRRHASRSNDTAPVAVRSAGATTRRPHHSSGSSSSSRRRLRCDAAAGGAEETFEGDLIANNAASLNGKLRTLVVSIKDARGEAYANHRKSSSGTLFKEERWIDGRVGTCHVTFEGILQSNTNGCGGPEEEATTRGVLFETSV
jgi:hypothetical protein